MNGHFIDTFRVVFKRKYHPLNSNIKFVHTDFGSIRVFDTQGNKPVVLNVPDGPNVIEHHEHLITTLSKHFRVICFEFPGFGFSRPSFKYDYSLDKSYHIILSLMDTMNIERATLAFSCANGFYAIKAAQMAPERFTYLFLAQTPSMHSMKSWINKTIPKTLSTPVIGQLANTLLEKKFANNWYKYALPKGTDISDYQNKALSSLKNGACFCLSGLVQGLSKDLMAVLNTVEVPATLIWGRKDFTHKKTNPKSILDHLPNCEIIEFADCGHFPELENTSNYVKLLNERIN